MQAASCWPTGILVLLGKESANQQAHFKCLFYGRVRITGFASLDIMNRSEHIYTMKSSPGRPLEFDPDAALDAAMQVFWRKGYESTSIQDLIDVMDVSKSSLYQAFGGKQPLFERCMAHYGDEMINAMRTDLENAPSGFAFIRRFLESVLDEARGVCEARGCLVMNTANEFARRNPRIAAAVSHGLSRFHDVLLTAVVRAQREGDIPPDHNPKMLATYLVSSMGGLKTMSKVGADEGQIKGIIDLTVKALL